MKLTKDDHPKLSTAIERAESKTGAEIVLVVKPRAGRYGDVHAAAAGVAVVLGLAFMIFSDVEFDPVHVIPMTLACAVVGGLASSLVVPRYFLRTRAAEAVEEAAHAQFSRLGVHRTTDRVGVLIYFAHAEASGRMLFDSGVAREIPDDERDAWRARLPQLRTADDLVALIDEMGERLGHAIPRGADDQNELADGVAA